MPRCIFSQPSSSDMSLICLFCLECFDENDCPDGEFECNNNICDCPKRKFLGESGDTCSKCPVGEKPEK